MLTFNGKLTAIGGAYYVGVWTGNRKVEVYQNGTWKDEIIPQVGNKDGKLYTFRSLAIEQNLFVFGKNKIIQNN